MADSSAPRATDQGHMMAFSWQLGWFGRVNMTSLFIWYFVRESGRVELSQAIFLLCVFSGSLHRPPPEGNLFTWLLSAPRDTD